VQLVQVGDHEDEELVRPPLRLVGGSRHGPVAVPRTVTADDDGLVGVLLCHGSTIRVRPIYRVVIGVPPA
jgi:hypothetical protein